MRVAIMQPYWAPYGGYFRLLSQSDLFVVYDCVQFPRRGRVHRNTLVDRVGAPQWLTLPLEHAPFEAKISDIHFGVFSGERIHAEMRRFAAFDDGHLPADVVATVEAVGGPFVPYLVEVLEACCLHLGFKPKVTYSSELGIPEDVRGQDRILEICRRLGAKKYLNSPGGRELYDADTFADSGVELEFLPDWAGRMESVLQVLSEKEAAPA